MYSLPSIILNMVNNVITVKRFYLFVFLNNVHGLLWLPGNHIPTFIYLNSALQASILVSEIALCNIFVSYHSHTWMRGGSYWNVFSSISISKFEYNFSRLILSSSFIIWITIIINMIYLYQKNFMWGHCVLYDFLVNRSVIGNEWVSSWVTHTSSTDTYN